MSTRGQGPARQAAQLDLFDATTPGTIGYAAEVQRIADAHPGQFSPEAVRLAKEPMPLMVDDPTPLRGTERAADRLARVTCDACGESFTRPYGAVRPERCPGCLEIDRIETPDPAAVRTMFAGLGWSTTRPTA